MNIIRNGTIVDGTGKPSFTGDIVIEGDRIADIVRHDGGALPTPADEADALDATGLIVSPGFIDAHAHSDAYLVLEPQAPSKISQGVTTEVNGQCGGSIAPRFGEARLSSDWASLLGERLTWHTLGEYRAVLEAAHPAINTVQFVGHNTLRSSVVGYADRTATADDLRQMAYLLEQALDEGGKGLTTGLIYQPGKYATPEEVVALARITAARGGFYATHMRSEGDRILESIDEVIDLVRATGIRAEISHLKTSGAKNWPKIDAVLDKMQAAVDAGLLLGSDRYPYCAAGTDLDIVLPDWAQVGAAKAEVARLADPEQRARIIREINASDRDWSAVMIGGTWSIDTKPFSGRTISDIIADKWGQTPGKDKWGQTPGKDKWGQTPGDLVAFILSQDLCRTGAFFFGMCEANLDKIYARPWIVPGSDASLRAPWGPLGADHPHPRAYGTMPEFYRRVRALGLSREEAVARMTSVPAKRFDLAGRGVLEKGAFADIVVWDEANFKSAATYDRPHAFATGIAAVFVNGIQTYDGAHGLLPQRAGRFLS